MILGASTETPAPWWLPFAILGAFVVVFPTFWCLIVLLISRLGSWHKLAKVYAAGPRKPEGQAHSGVTGQLGLASYRFTLTVTTAPDGFFLTISPFFRMGHPPLFIPWSEVAERSSQKLLFWDMTVLKIGSPKVATIALGLPGKALLPPA